jgi:predicted nucleotidyltransferase
MAQTKVYLSDSVDAQVRETAMKRFGYGRGSISKAVETAVVQWLAMEEGIWNAIAAMVEKARKDPNVIGLMLFGSYARREPNFGDVDVALVLDNLKANDSKEYEDALRGRGGRARFDIVVFSQLPLDLQRTVMNEAQVLYARNGRDLRGVSAEVAERWEEFKPTFEYLLSR